MMRRLIVDSVAPCLLGHRHLIADSFKDSLIPLSGSLSLLIYPFILAWPPRSRLPANRRLADYRAWLAPCVFIACLLAGAAGSRSPSLWHILGLTFIAGRQARMFSSARALETFRFLGQSRAVPFIGGRVPN